MQNIQFNIGDGRCFMCSKDIKINNKNAAEKQNGVRKSDLGIIMLLGAASLLGRKIYEILKRKYSVIGIQEQYDVDDYETLSINEVKRVGAFMIYNGIKIVIINMECLYRIYDNLDNLYKVINLCHNRAIKIILIFQESTIKVEELNKILDVLRKQPCFLVVQVGITYGYIAEKCNGEVADKNIKLASGDFVLADHVALWLLHNIDEVGQFYFSHEFEQKYFGKCWDSEYIIGRQKSCIFSLVYKCRPEDYIKRKNIAWCRLHMGRMLAVSLPNSLISQIDFVTPVPQTGLYYAMGLAEGISKPYLQALMKEGTAVRSFQVQDTDNRKKLLWGKIKPIAELVQGKSIAVVDEAIFTGTTLRVICEMLRECGARKIFLCIPTPRCRYHCDYLVLPERDMLLEYIREDMLADYFDADEVFFQDDEKFYKMITSWGYACSECFFGRDKNG